VIVPAALSIGEATTFSPFAAEYQVIPLWSCITDLASNVCIGLVSHCVILLELTDGALGAGKMVNLTPVLVKLLQSELFTASA
jgi:hypothetical protein